MYMSPGRRAVPPPDKSPRRKPDDLTAECSIIRKGTGSRRHFSNGAFTLEKLQGTASFSELRPALVTILPGASSEDIEIYVGEKWFYVLEGKLEVHVNGTPHLLSEGDSMYLEYTAAHTWRNAHNGKTRALVISSPSSLSIDTDPAYPGLDK
ncbi:MAG: cupin domain-containing protein [Candidatus Abyssobacteria bacterium SURF_17]|uniref:Cupin domain-containing protein n=1 Tax=Candidatus Abyssobacteria bacterium SURF_17 TaxID=2093361 RepID=A0A419EWQ5_9BACT|nr:MAG: cupin domain-containing protein [Candidatus Abyssubacteria bacterium SURF_17]